MSNTIDYSGPLRGWLVRAPGFLGVWLILSGFKAGDLVVGMVAAGLATWASLRLLPSGQWGFHPVALAGFIIRFLRQSIVAGVDVALRAFDPRLPLQTGFVVYQSRLPPGSTRNAFCTEASLLPGTLPAGLDENGGLVFHCLDVGQPVVEQLAAEEASFMRALGGARRHG